MGTTTQDRRLLSISTPLGKDHLLLNRLTVTEGLSQLFTVDVELLHEENEAGYKPTMVDIQSILGQSVTVVINHRDDTKRTLNGIVNQFTQGDRDIRFTYYYATIVPAVWLLTQNFKHRIFQHKTVPDILKKVFEGFEVAYEIQGNFQPRNFCVQYGESDFDFASRLMEEEGIYYYFEHKDDGTHKMIIGNTPQSHRDTPSQNEIEYYLKVLESEVFVSSIKNFQVDYRLQSGKITFWDHHFQRPGNKLNAEKPSRFNVGGNQKLEIYDFPGGYARKYDDLDNGSGEVGAASEDKEKTAENTIQALDGRYRTATGMANFCGMTAGYKFKLKNHPNGDYNAEYIITEITHQAEQSPDYTSEDTIPEPYRNNFTCITYGSGSPPYRPLRRTPKPLVTGSQTAYVVGPAGEEIFTDKFGRVKVQFHWDREGKNDSDSSCWLRVAQSWAGNKWGTMFIPRIGMEVIVDFLEGNPDQPIITGCVYNPEMMPPYTLPDEKTKATIKSNSSKGGGGFNEFRFEDKKGSEQIFIHAEKNEDIRVKNDCMETIVHDRHLVVKNDQLEKVTYDKHLILGGDRNEKIGGSQSLNVGGSIQEKAGMKYAMDAGTEVHIKAGMNAVIEAGMSLTIKASGGFINIGPTGVTISGTMVLINSGGAAGTGSGSNPEAPKEAKEADTADPGDRPMPPKPSPPLKPETYSQQAQAIQNSAEDGTAFTEI